MLLNCAVELCTFGLDLCCSERSTVYTQQRISYHLSCLEIPRQSTLLRYYYHEKIQLTVICGKELSRERALGIYFTVQYVR
jgi:hypothetical protein